MMDKCLHRSQFLVRSEVRPHQTFAIKQVVESTMLEDGKRLITAFVIYWASRFSRL